MREVDDLVDLYFTSVGRNSKLLLNVPPTPEGVLHETDATRLRGMNEALTALFEDDLATGGRRTRTVTGPRAAVQEIDLGQSLEVGVADLREDVRAGQSVAGYRLEGLVDGSWRTLSLGLTIGYQKLDRWEPVPLLRLRLHVEDGWGTPPEVSVALFAGRSRDGAAR